MNRNHKRHASSNRGAILIEALVGGAMLGTGLAVLLSITSNAMSQQRLGEERVIAASLLDEMLSMVLVEGPMDYEQIHETFGTFAAPFERYSFELDIQDQGEIEPYMVTATVKWFSMGYNREAAVRTFISYQRNDGLLEPREPGEPISR